MKKIFFKQRRLGKDGKTFVIYKLNTMIPDAEKSFDEVVKNNGHGLYGKLKNDSRITKSGKILRKYWIDELPQIFNIFRGDMTLVGVRPTPQNDFNKFPEHLQSERNRYKPGLMNIVYADKNVLNHEDRIKSEEKYFKKKALNPITTDINYFFKIAYNILFKGARGV